MSKKLKPYSKTPKVSDSDKLSETVKGTEVSKTLLDTPTETPKKDVKFSKKTVNDLLGNLENMGFSSDEIKDVTKTMELIENKGCVTSGQGGGTSYDTEEITKFRKNFESSVNDISDGHDITKTGIKRHYVMDKNGKKRFPMLYLRSEKEINKKTKK